MIEKKGWVLLDDQKVRKMRSTPYYRGMYVQLAALYGIDVSALRKAVIGQTWKNVK